MRAAMNGLGQHLNNECNKYHQCFIVVYEQTGEVTLSLVLQQALHVSSGVMAEEMHIQCHLGMREAGWE